jgi:hypothetical protein
MAKRFIMYWDVIEKLANVWLCSCPEDAPAEYYQCEESYQKHLLICAKRSDVIALCFTGRGIINSYYV